jgi:hypothetical protein
MLHTGVLVVPTEKLAEHVPTPPGPVALTAMA